jgi:serine protease Do
VSCGTSWGADPVAGLAEFTAATAASAEESAEILKQAGRHLASIAARVTPAVVNIESTREGRGGTIEETGSGVLIRTARANGTFVITNRHVVANARLSQIELLLSDGRVVTPLEKLEDPASDVAVLRIQDPGIEAAQFGDSDNLDIGHFVMAMGSPFGLTRSVTLGIISAKGRRSLELPGDRRLINQDFLQTDAAINPGNSGGPLVDLHGRVVGINTAIASQGGGNEGIGFSIPSNLVNFVVSQLLEHGRVRRGYLGVELDENFDLEAARRYSLDRKYGARVTKVLDRTPAAAGGMRADDIILNFDGFVIEDETDLINRVSLTAVNKRVRVVVLREGREVPLTVVLSEKPEPNQRSEIRPADTVPGVNDRFRATGFSVFECDSALAVQLGYRDGARGLIVKQVSGNPEADALQVYDLIEEVARQPVHTPEELEAALADLAAQPCVVFKVRRVVDGESASRLVLWRLK